VDVGIAWSGAVLAILSVSFDIIYAIETHVVLNDENDVMLDKSTYSVEISYEGGNSFSLSDSDSTKGNAGSPAAPRRDGRLAAATAAGSGVSAESGDGDAERRERGVAGVEGNSLLWGSTTYLSLSVTLISGILILGGEGSK
jgi:hypothetical protein